jgi:hypothetical protein
MAAPHIHAISSAKRFGGKMEDYIEIHSKSSYASCTDPDFLKIEKEFEDLHKS